MVAISLTITSGGFAMVRQKRTVSRVLHLS